MNNKALIVLVIILTISVISLGGYIIYDNLTPEVEYVEESNKRADKKEEVESKAKIKETINITNYNSGIYLALYNYHKSGNKDLKSYLTSLDNNHKLFISGIMEERNFEKLKNNLENIFGSDLQIEAKDYYITKNDEQAFLIYNKSNDEFTLNPNFLGGDVITDMGDTFISNYQLKDITYEDNQFVITYYGLYSQCDSVGPCTYTNGKSLEFVGEKGYEIDNYFSSQKANFLEFSYIYTKDKNDYVLTDFKAK